MPSTQGTGKQSTEKVLGKSRADESPQLFCQELTTLSKTYNLIWNPLQIFSFLFSPLKLTIDLEIAWFSGYLHLPGVLPWPNEHPQFLEALSPLVLENTILCL